MSETNDPNAALRTSRSLWATPAEVFATFAQPELLARWWGPAGFTNTFEQFEFAPGGRWVFVMHGPDGVDYPNENVFREIVPHTRIVLEHVVSPWFRLTVALTPHGAQTHLAWEQAFATAQVADQLRGVCEPSNEQVLDRLEAVLSDGRAAANTDHRRTR